MTHPMTPIEGDDAEKIENALQAASETHSSWKHRCYAIMGALGYDVGNPDWAMPDEIEWIRILKTEHQRLLQVEADLQMLCGTKAPTPIEGEYVPTPRRRIG